MRFVELLINVAVQYCILIQAKDGGNVQVTVSEMMDRWTKQMGYPVITLTRNTDSSVTLVQERFLQNPLPENGTVAPSIYK